MKEQGSGGWRERAGQPAGRQAGQGPHSTGRGAASAPDLACVTLRPVEGALTQALRPQGLHCSPCKWGKLAGAGDVKDCLRSLCQLTCPLCWLHLMEPSHEAAKMTRRPRTKALSCYFP